MGKSGDLPGLARRANRPIYYVVALCTPTTCSHGMALSVRPTQLTSNRARFRALTFSSPEASSS